IGDRPQARGRRRIRIEDPQWSRLSSVFHPSRIPMGTPVSGWRQRFAGKRHPPSLGNGEREIRRRTLMGKLKTTPFDVVDYLRTPEERAAYLQATLEDCNGDIREIMHALGDI